MTYTSTVLYHGTCKKSNYSEWKNFFKGDRDWQFMATWSCTTLLQAKRVGGHIQEENAKRSWQISRGDDKDILIIDVERETREREREHYWQGPVLIAFSCVSGNNIHMYMYMTTLKRWHFLCMVHSNICHSFQTRTISDYLYFIFLKSFQ